MPPLKIAHRGAMAEAPENTRSAFDRAVHSGVDGIEFDVQITKDGVPVIYHDGSLRKITGVASAIPDYTHAALRGFDFGNWFSEQFQKEPILTLEETLAAYGQQVRLFIEIKSSPNPQSRLLYDELPGLVVDQVNALIPEVHLPGVHILAFDPAMLRAAFLKAPDLKYILNLEAPFSDSGFPDTGADLLYGCCLEHVRLSRRFVEQCRLMGKKVFTYSCDTVEAIQRAMDLGVDGIMTDDPGGGAWRQFFEALNN